MVEKMSNKYKEGETYSKIDSNLKEAEDIHLPNLRANLIDVDEKKKTLGKEYQEKLAARMDTLDAIEQAMKDRTGTTGKMALYKLPLVGGAMNWVMGKLGKSDLNMSLAEISELQVVALEEVDGKYVDLLREATEVYNSSEKYVQDLLKNKATAIEQLKEIAEDVATGEKAIEELKGKIETADQSAVTEYEMDLLAMEGDLEELYFLKEQKDNSVIRASTLIGLEKEVLKKAYDLEVKELKRTKIAIGQAVSDTRNLFNKLQMMSKMGEAAAEGIGLYEDIREFTNKMAALTTEELKGIAMERDVSMEQDFMEHTTVEKMKKDVSDVEAYEKARADRNSGKAKAIIEERTGAGAVEETAKGKGKGKKKYEKL